MKSRFSSLLLGALASVAVAAPKPPTETESFSAREMAQGYRQQIVLARPLPAHRATIDSQEAGEGLRVQERFPRFRDLRVIEVAPTDDVADVIARLRASGRYEFVEPDYIRHVAFEPADPSFTNGDLWGLKNNGGTNGIVGADIQATDAWDLIREASNVVVAVVDTGVNINHQDLAGNIWRNPAPTFGDINGARFVGGSVSGNPADDNGHGTHVAGTIGAIGNNTVGVAGIAWRVQIMPVKVFPATGYGSVSDIVRGVNYAVSHGAHIINASYGESGSSGFTPSASELAAINGARDAGVIFVAAAGNAGLNIDVTRVYPASHAAENMIAVGASTRRDELALFSNYGSVVDLFAPGAEIVSLSHTSNTGTSVKSGTSMAAPHVTGAMALLKARFPEDNYRQLINRLLRGVERADRFQGKAHTGGRLNLYHALSTTTNRPFNDNFAERARMTGDNLRLRASNAGATLEPGEPTQAGYTPAATLWWEWSPSINGTVIVDTTGSNQDTLLAVYTASNNGTPNSVADLSFVASNDNDPTQLVITSRLSFSGQAGARYYIAAGSRLEGGGLTMLNVNTTPANDLFNNPALIEGSSVRITGFNGNATKETGDPTIYGWRGGHSLWYRWTAPRSGRFQFSLVSPEFNPVLGVFTGASFPLTYVSESDNANFSQVHTGGLCTVEAIAGTTYSIMVDGREPWEGGQFTLTLVDSSWQAITGDNITSTVAVGSDGTLYVGSTDNSIYALSPDGGLKWSARTGGFIDTCSPAVAPDGTVYVGSNDGKVYAFTPTGSSKWTRDFGTSAPMSNSPSLAADGTIYIKGGDGFLYALNPADGSTKWRYDVHGPVTYASASVAADGTIYQGSDDKKLYALNPDGTLKWTFTADNDIYTVPAIDSAGNIYFAVLNSGKLYSVTASGNQRWVYSGATLGATSSPSLSADGSTVYFAGYDSKLHAVNATSGAGRWTYTLGNEVRASSPAVDANGVIYIGCYDAKLYAINADGTLKRTYATGDWVRSSPAISGTTLYIGSNDAKLYAFDIGVGAAAGPWSQYRQNVRRLGRAVAPPAITIQPFSQFVTAGGSVSLAAAAGDDSASYQWQRNGTNITSGTNATYTISNLQPASTGLYDAVVSNGMSVSTNTAVVGLLTTDKAAGSASELRADIVHPNTFVYDQVQLHGAAASITADPGQIVRLSFIDLSNDIVQVEFSGAGTLSIVLENPTGPATAQNYVQPGINYMRGHAGIVIAGADETTNVSVFSVGRITAVNQSLFRSDVTYDGLADIAYIAILSSNGRFGGVRTGNASFFNTRSLTGIYAPGVQFTGPVVVGDISAADSATGVLMLGSASDTSITGGDLLQSNGRMVRVSGISALRFIAGTNSHGTTRPAQTNRAQLEQNGAVVTNQIVVNPSP